MFSVNGIPLDNPDLGWSVQSATEPHLGFSRRSVDLQAGQRRGNVGVAAGEASPVMPIVVRSPLSGLEPLLALFDPQFVTISKTLRWADVEVLAVTPGHLNDGELTADVQILLRFNGVYWRDYASTTETYTWVDGTETFDLAAGLSAPIADAVIRQRGGVSGLRIQDSGGSWFSYAPVLSSTQYLRFEADTGRAYVTTSDTWTGGTEVTGQIVNGPGPYFFEMVPVLVTPTDRRARLTITGTLASGVPQTAVRSKRAYRV